MDYDRLRELQEKFEENPRRYFAPLANEYRKGGQPKRAIEICRSQLAQMPGHMSGQIVYGQSLYECGEFDEAREVFERALKLDPENLIALRTLGDLSLQSGNTADARKWYMRLLDADPKDAAVIALVSEIEASAEASVPVPEEIPGVDTDAGDQAIPYITDLEGTPTSSGSAPPASAAGRESPADAQMREREAAAASAPESASSVEAASASESASSFEPTSAAEPVEASAPESQPYAGSEAAPPAGFEATSSADPISAGAVDPVSAGAVDSIEAGFPDEGLGAEGLRGGRQDELMGAEGLLGTEPEVAEPVGAEGLSGNAPAQALAGTTSKISDDDSALETWTPPPGATVHERKESRKEDRMISGSGPGPEPFVNETMAQLYLQQGYRQLALRVYYQLAESRPDDQVLKARIAEIEAADSAAHPESAPQPERAQPSAAAREEAPPPQAAQSREPAEPRREPAEQRRESADVRARETSGYDAPRAEPESIGARQPSVREFFATLGRRRPPRSAGNSGGSARTSRPAPSDAGMPADTGMPRDSAAPSASLDAVFAGATVNQADSRAAARLAGAFSGTAGTSRTPAPTPPMPTPRVNPRVPQAQESEEDVAKFRAWLDGLTGE
jgi:tetratricopeptide (TPR) repeat protein